MSIKESLAGKSVLVTGASRGLGRAVVERLHSYGCKVYGLSQNQENLNKLEQDFPGIKTICVDLGNCEETRAALLPLEPIDCLVNNAAAILCKSIMNTGPNDFDRLYGINVKGMVNVSQIFANKLIEAKKPGSIVNISSIGAAIAFTLTASYCASKAAAEHTAKCLAVELGPHNIRVNVVRPALMKTDMTDDLALAFCELVNDSTGNKDLISDLVQTRTPLAGGPMMDLDGVVNSILFLLSDLSPQVTGQVLAVDGGYLVT